MIAYDYYSLMPRLIFVRKKRSPNFGADAEQREKAGRYARGANAFRFGKSSQVDAAARVRGHFFEDLAAPSPIEIVRSHHRVVIVALCQIPLPHGYQSLRMVKGKGPEQNCVDYAKDRGVRADSKG
jgi:hypothetical protein